MVSGSGGMLVGEDGGGGVKELWRRWRTSTCSACGKTMVVMDGEVLLSDGTVWNVDGLEVSKKCGCEELPRNGWNEVPRGCLVVWGEEEIR